ncbi:VOC family protein [Georgenia sp. MJ206]|uniref:VOC family protein n=1 Tax=Georgenia wangjunii TaxID=3117730 RepID=UPI002F262B71
MSNALEKYVLTPAEAHARPGLEDWRVLRSHLHAAFRTGSMTRGLELVERVVAAAEALDHHPDIDLRYFRVHLVLTTHATRSLTEADVALAAQISVIAAEMGLRAEPGLVQHVEIAIDALDIPSVLPFWKAALGYRAQLPPGEEDETDADLQDRSARGPSVWFQQMDSPRPQRNRIHLDIDVPHDEARSRVDAVLAAGGRLVTDEYAPSYWVLADAEGNEACICTWQGRG